jgi:NAD(P)-dependent dehydrogenase (short-subunit alcohol dehydrogenase family)
LTANRTILITGCSSGIGYASARMLKEKGWRVFATARKDADIIRLEGEGFEALRLDYTEPVTISECVAEVAQRTEGKPMASRARSKIFPAPPSPPSSRPMSSAGTS